MLCEIDDCVHIVCVSICLELEIMRRTCHRDTPSQYYITSNPVYFHKKDPGGFRLPGFIARNVNVSMLFLPVFHWNENCIQVDSTVSSLLIAKGATCKNCESANK